MPAWIDKREVTYEAFAQLPPSTEEPLKGFAVFFDERFINAGELIPPEVDVLAGQYRVRLCNGCTFRVGDRESFEAMVEEGLKRSGDKWCTGAHPRRMVLRESRDKVTLAAFSPNDLFFYSSSVPCAQLPKPITLP